MKVKILILGMISFLTASCQTFDEKIFKSSSFFSDNSKLDFGIMSQPNLSKIKPKYNEFTVRNANSNIKKAILAHPSHQKNIASFKILKSNNKIAEAGLKPQVNFQGIGGLVRADEKNNLGASGSVNLIKLIYDYGATEQAIKAQNERIKGAKFEITTQAETLAFAAYQVWINLSTQRKILDIYNSGINRAAPLVEKIDKISISGVADSTMLLRARKEYSETVVEMKKIEVLEKVAEVNFKDIFHLEKLGKIQPLKSIEVGSLKSLEIEMIKSSPSIKAKKSLIKSLKITRDSLVAQKNPNFSFRAGLNAPAENTLKNSSGNVGFLMNYVYNDGGRLDAQIESASNQIKFSELELENSIKVLKAELNSAYESYSGANKTRKNLLNVIKISKEVRDNLNEQLAIGRAKLQDLLSAEVNLAKNEILLINTEAEMILSSYKIKSLSTGIFPGYNWN